MNGLLGKLGLGASQFPSGPSVRGRPPEAEVREMLLTAGRAGLGFLDAGQAQASAEQTLGAQMPRPAPFHILIRSVRGDRGPDLVEAEVRATLVRLGPTQARAVGGARGPGLFAPPGPALWASLR